MKSAFPQESVKFKISFNLKVKPFKEQLIQYFNQNECPVDIFDSIKFELEMTNLNDTLSRFKLSKLYKKMIDEESIHRK
jgi:hypothetical protein